MPANQIDNMYGSCRTSVAIDEFRETLASVISELIPSTASEGIVGSLLYVQHPLHSGLHTHSPMKIGTKSERCLAELTQYMKAGVRPITRTLDSMHLWENSPRNFISLQVAFERTEPDDLESFGTGALRASYGKRDPENRIYPPSLDPDNRQSRTADISMILYGSQPETPPIGTGTDRESGPSKSSRRVLRRVPPEAKDQLKINSWMTKHSDELRNDYGPGCAYICQRLGLSYSPLSRDALTSGLISLADIADQNGATQAFTIVTRPDTKSGLSIGLVLFTSLQVVYQKYVIKLGNQLGKLGHSIDTCIANNNYSSNHISESILQLSQSFEKPTNALSAGQALHVQELISDKIRPVSEYIPESLQGTTEPLIDVAKSISSSIAQSIPHLSKPSLLKATSKTEYQSLLVARFLEICTYFCDRSEEGVQRKYAFALDDPLDVCFWPGPWPIPIAGRQTRAGTITNTWLELGDILAKDYLLYDPTERLSFIHPAWLDRRRENMPVLPLVTADVSRLRSELGEWPKSRYMDYTSGLYNMLTSQRPNMLVCLIGPGATARVVSRGQTHAIRTGRGWRSRIDVANMIREVSNAKNIVRPPKRAFEAALICAEQLSSYLHTRGHGGLLAWAPKRKTFRLEESNQSLKPNHISAPGLREPAPSRFLSDQGEWLDGRSIITDYKEIDCSVIKQIVRAGSADGAVCLSGKRCKVIGTCRRLTSRLDTTVSVGTKRGAASAFANSGSDGRFAISVSSDGPIRIHWKGLPHEGVRIFEHH